MKAGFIWAVLFSTFATGKLVASVPEQVRTGVDAVIKAHGAYVIDEGVYRFVFPREAATIVRDWQSLSPALGLNSWVAFSSAVHDEAVLSAQFLLLPDEVNAVLSAALKEGLEVTGLAQSTGFFDRRLFTLDLNGLGKFLSLARSVRTILDQIDACRRLSASGHAEVNGPTFPDVNSIDAQPINEILSMRGSVAAGVYMGAIGRRALVRGEQFGREMGLSTWISIFGTKEKAMAHGEILASTDDLQNVLKALRARDVSVTSIRNHTFGEHPSLVFVQYWTSGPALQLANAIRFVLDVQTGRSKLGNNR